MVSEEKLSLDVNTSVFMYINCKNETACFDPAAGSSSGEEILKH
jgi:hypothetical protein